MRTKTKKQLENFIDLLPNINKCILKNISTDIQQALFLMADCYDGIDLIYHMIVESEGEKHIALVEVEKYKQQLEIIYTFVLEEKLDDAKEGCESLMVFSNMLKEAVLQIKEKLEVVFMPYKAAMWDSLESVWIEADADPDCDAYVVPIPYYERNKDYSLGTYHYEGELMPSEVPITHYDDYNLKERRPDVIYIHNPYDGANYVTSVDPRFYSDKLKKYTDCLVYIPYYSTSGGMAEAQEKCPVYYNADYIVIQAEKYRKFFDPALPDEKFLPFGSPKFDKVIRICNNPPQTPLEWAEKIKNKKVYFYNTSLGGMLANTDAFFKKMEYVFNCFKERKDACILWRPHPLFESTIDSMRPLYRPIYDRLKRNFIQSNVGIFDNTPDITNTIAICDAYIGDAGTSVTSLFGVAGKPMFILNNNIHHLPEEDDWRGEIIRDYWRDVDDDWKITRENKLYHAENSDYNYHYVCDLCKYAGGEYFSSVITIEDKSYVCPANAQEIVVIEKEQIIERIQLKHEIEQQGVFAASLAMEDDIYLIPYRYPAIVCYHTKTKKIEYIKGYNQYFVKQVQGEWRIGGYCVWNQYLLIASPIDNKVVAINNHTGKVELLSTGASHTCGCIDMLSDGRDMWMLPFTGTIITRWNPKTGERKEYFDLPKGFMCKNRPNGYPCEDRAFVGIAFSKKYVYFSPAWGNMFIRIDKTNGKIEEWKSSFPILEREKNEYYENGAIGYFGKKTDSLGDGTYHYFSVFDAKLYDINLNTEEYKEIPIVYEKSDLLEYTSGFSEMSDWLKYCCKESYFCTLIDFFNGTIKGNVFEKEKQIQSYVEINVSYDGNCGKQVQAFIKKRKCR